MHREGTTLHRFQTMPHITTWNGLIARQAGPKATDDFIKLGDIKAEFVADELTGNFDALNETTNVKPTKDESISIVHPEFKTGYDTDSSDSLSETFGDGDPRILGPISGEGVFKPQDIDTKGSVIVGDNHFNPASGGDSITGEGCPLNDWTNGSASELEDRMSLDTSASFMHQGAMNSLQVQDGAGNVRDAGVILPGNDEFSERLRSENRFVIERFESIAKMNSFGESHNPVMAVGVDDLQDAQFITGMIGDNSGQIISPLSGCDGCPF